MLCPWALIVYGVHCNAPRAGAADQRLVLRADRRHCCNQSVHSIPLAQSSPALPTGERLFGRTMLGHRFRSGILSEYLPFADPIPGFQSESSAEWFSVESSTPLVCGIRGWIRFVCEECLRNSRRPLRTV